MPGYFVPLQSYSGQCFPNPYQVFPFPTFPGPVFPIQGFPRQGFPTQTLWGPGFHGQGYHGQEFVSYQGQNFLPSGGDDFQRGTAHPIMATNAKKAKSRAKRGRKPSIVKSETPEAFKETRKIFLVNEFNAATNADVFVDQGEEPSESLPLEALLGSLKETKGDVTLRTISATRRPFRRSSGGRPPVLSSISLRKSLQGHVSVSGLQSSPKSMKAKTKAALPRTAMTKTKKTSDVGTRPRTKRTPWLLRPSESRLSGPIQRRVSQ